MKDTQPIVHGTDGTQWMHRALIALLRLVGVRPFYAVMAVFVVPFYVVLRRRAFLAIWHYMRRRRGYGWWATLRMTLLNHYRFGQVVIDRFAIYAGLKFRFDVVNNEQLLNLCRDPEGFIILSSHVGNYEMAGYTFRSTDKRFNALVYGGEAPAVMENRQRMFAANNIRMIPVAGDMSHIFAMNAALADGEIVSIPADRVFGSPRTVGVRFLGAEARLPLGPFAMALQRETKVVAMFVMKEDTYRYRIYIRPLEPNFPGWQDDPAANAGADPVAARDGNCPAALAQLFAKEVETILRLYPEQWYNYFEFWGEET